MNKLRNMQLFCRVAERGNFSRVAQDSGVTPAIVGRHMTELEEALSVRLFNRSTRSVTLTTAGQAYYDGCKEILSQIDTVEQQLRADNAVSPSGTVRLSAPEGMGSPILLGFIETFTAEYDQISFDLLLENEHTDLRDHQVDVAIRFATALEDSSLTVQKLASTRLSLFAAPDLLARAKVPKTLADLGDLPCLHFGISRTASGWPVLKNGKLSRFRQPWTLSVGQTHVHHEAMIRGMGFGLSLDLFAAPHVAAGKLVRVDLAEAFPEVGIFALYPSRRLIPQKTTLVVSHLKATLAALTRDS